MNSSSSGPDSSNNNHDAAAAAQPARDDSMMMWLPTDVVFQDDDHALGRRRRGQQQQQQQQHNGDDDDDDDKSSFSSMPSSEELLHEEEEGGGGVGCMGGVKGVYASIERKQQRNNKKQHNDEAADPDRRRQHLPRTDTRAGFWQQTNALLRKNLTFQFRNWGTNLALVITPIAFLALLVVLQLVVNRQLSTPSNRCGCECLRCCAYEKVYDNVTNSATFQRVCRDSSDDPEEGRLCSPYAECELYNETNCGLQYSTSDQSIFCAIERPLAWPPLLQLPKDGNRAPDPPPGSEDVGPDGEITGVSPLLWPTNATPMMFTGSDRAAAEYLADGLLARSETLEEALNRLIVAALTAQAVFPQSAESNDMLSRFVTPTDATTTNNATTTPTTPEQEVEEFQRKQADQDRRQRLLQNVLASAQSGGGVGEFLSSAMFGGDPTSQSPPTPEQVQAMRDISRAFQNMNLRYATAAPASYSLYLEPAFMPSADVGAVNVLGSNSGGTGGFSGGDDPNEAVVGAAANSRSSAALEDEITAMLEPRPLWYAFIDCGSISEAAAGAMQTASEALRDNLGIELRCTSAPPVWLTQPEDIDEAIYCAWRSSTCEGVYAPPPNVRDGIPQYGNAQFDFGFSSLEPQAASAVRTAVIGGKSQRFDVSLWFNSSQLASSTRPDGGPGAVPKLDRVNAPINLASNAALRAMWPTSLSDYKPSANLRGLKDTPKPSSELLIEFSTLIGPVFYLWLLNLMLPVNVYALVYEKGSHLRIMMKMGGLSDMTYYFVTYWYMWLIYAVYSLLFVIAGAFIFQLPYFKNNDIGLQIVFYLVYGHVITALSFFFACFFSNARTSLVMMLLFVFISGLVANVAIQEIVVSSVKGMWAVQIFPPFALYRGLWEFGQYGLLAPQVGGVGMTWASLTSDEGNGMLMVLYIMIVDWFVLLIASYYLDQVTDSGTGVRKHWLWFLRGCCARRRERQLRREEMEMEEVEMTANATTTTTTAAAAAASAGRPSVVDVSSSSEDEQQCDAEDVVGEASRVEHLLRQHASSSESAAASAAAPAVMISHLRKQYPRKLAVHDLSMAIGRTECFGLLGPNGAGKSTTLGVLTGLSEPTSGEAHICGLKLGGTTMDEVYGKVGVCPQHDLLWGQLTAREHLLFYGRLKNLSGATLRAEVRRGLDGVALLSVADVPCGKFSGGMRRRLSVAIALIGSPSVVFLDEPTTGMDPVSRRYVWDIILKYKRNACVVLTTHSMEEADVLGDRIGIIVGGRLRCIGEPRALASRFAGYYVVAVTAEDDGDAGRTTRALHDRWLARMNRAFGGEVRAAYALGTSMRFEVPNSGATLAQLFDVMEANRDDWGLVDWGVSSATLDDVFVQVSVSAGAGVEEK